MMATLWAAALRWIGLRGIIAGAVSAAALGYAALQMHRAGAADAARQSSVQELQGTKAELAQVREANMEAQNTIAAQEAQRIATDVVVTALQDTLRRLTQRTGTLSARLRDLEATNDTVRDYLALPVPERVRRLLQPPSDAGTRPDDRSHGDRAGADPQRVSLAVCGAAGGLSARHWRPRARADCVARGSTQLRGAGGRLARLGS